MSRQAAFNLIAWFHLLGFVILFFGIGLSARHPIVLRAILVSLLGFATYIYATFERGIKPVDFSTLMLLLATSALALVLDILLPTTLAVGIEALDTWQYLVALTFAHSVTALIILILLTKPRSANTNNTADCQP